MVPITKEEVRALLDDNAYHVLSLATGGAARALYYAAPTEIVRALELGNDDIAFNIAWRLERAEEQASELRYELAWASWAIRGQARRKGNLHE